MSTTNNSMTWKEAIITVLKQNKFGDSYVPMNYRDITNKIINDKLVQTYGKTPANTVSQTLTTSPGIFTRVEEGVYALATIDDNHKENIEDNSQNGETVSNNESNVVVSTEIKQLVPSYGMFWEREAINWDSTPKLLGVQATGALPIDLSEMRGIYMLYDGREVIYVGQAVDRPIIKRLLEHTKNRLATRWNRFSWFGLDSVDPQNGQIIKSACSILSDLYSLANALEGILIEGLEPRQNRKRGDNFGFEYYQKTDKTIIFNRAISDIKSCYDS